MFLYIVRHGTDWIMGRKLTSYNGEDKIYTPDELANAIVQELKPKGIVLEPCMGEGAFTRAVSKYGLVFEWCEINKGIDFFDKETTNADWMITNPPFSKVFKFIKKGIELDTANITLDDTDLFEYRLNSRSAKIF